MLALTCAAMALRSSGKASRIAALGRMSKLNEAAVTSAMAATGGRQSRRGT